MKKMRLTTESGFTLIELLVVIVVLGLLAGMIAPKLLNQTDKAKIVRAQGDIISLSTALDMYKLDSGIYPDTEQGLLALIEAPTSGTLPKKWAKGGYLKKNKLPKDPWGNDYVYICPGANGDYDISSFGADGISGGEDNNKDVNSWEIE